MFSAHVFMSNGSHSQQLESRNKAVCSPIIALFKKACLNEEINKLPADTIASILIGPAENYSRAWLAKRVTKAPADHAATFAAAAWAAFAYQAPS